MDAWRDFAGKAPELAAHGRRLLLIDTPEMPGAGLGYLATVRADGGPRVHPISPALHDDRLWAFVLHGSPKLDDLIRDGRYALHSWPLPFEDDGFNDEEWYLEGRAVRIVDPALTAGIAAIVGDDPTRGDVFELRVGRVLHKHRVDGRVVYDRWPAEATGSPAASR